MNKILIVDASDSDRRLMLGLLVKSGYDPIAVDSMEAAKEEVAKLPPGAVIVADYKLPDGSAKELVNWLKSGKHYIPIIAIVNNRTCPEATDVMENHGAVAVIQRPAIDKELVDYVSRYVKDIDSATPPDEKLIDRPSDEFKKVKELIARQIYLQSSRTQKPLKVLEAGSAPLVGRHDPESDRSEIFNRIEGYFKEASGGTLIIKNIQLLTFETQSVLLHILEEEHPDVRILSTAGPGLLKMVSDGSFRDNLFFILRQTSISVPPLRESTDDIADIADYLLTRYAQKKRRPKQRLDASDSITVANIPPKFIRQTPLCEMAGDEYPFIPDKFRMSLTMKELERELKPIFRQAS